MQKVPLRPQEILEKGKLERGGEKNLILNLIGMKDLPFVCEDSVPVWWLCCDSCRTE